MSEELEYQFSFKETKTAEHHHLSQSVTKSEYSTVSKNKAAIMRHGNLFAIESHTLYKLITHAYLLDQYFLQIRNIINTGQKLYEQYILERINGRVSLLAPVMKKKNKMYINGSRSHIVEVRSSRDIDQKHAIGNHEFTLISRALFAPSGSMLPCNHKSKLIHVLKNLGRTETSIGYAQLDEDTQTAAGNENPKLISQMLAMKTTGKYREVLY